jgi:hypothetical protein
LGVKLCRRGGRVAVTSAPAETDAQHTRDVPQLTHEPRTMHRPQATLLKSQLQLDRMVDHRSLPDRRVVPQGVHKGVPESDLAAAYQGAPVDFNAPNLTLGAPRVIRVASVMPATGDLDRVRVGPDAVDLGFEQHSVPRSSLLGYHSVIDLRLILRPKRPPGKPQTNRCGTVVSGPIGIVGSGAIVMGLELGHGQKIDYYLAI